jgi:hypothetical protein
MSKTPRTVGLVSLALLTIACLPVSGQQPRPSSRSRGALSGTYELEDTRGGNPRRAAETATRSLPPGQRDRAFQTLLARLEPPQTLSIDRDGWTVTIVSSRGPRSSFEADGQPQRERGQNGQTITTRAALDTNRLTVSTNGGSRGSDFVVTFEALNNGANLLVTRRLDDDDLARPVTIESYYRRTLSTPRWDLYRDAGYDQASDFAIVPDGTRLLATLDTPLSMRSSRHGENFTMTVRSPEEFQGARIDGVLSRGNGSQNDGRDLDMRFDFQTLRLRGRSSDFDAVLNTVRLSDGSLFRVNSDDYRRESGVSDTTVRNGAIGATLGAIIGAIAGGGKGAAIGAIGGGAGGVILSQGHEQFDVRPGSDVTLTAFSRLRHR